MDAVGSGAELEVGVQVFFVVGEVAALEDGRVGELCREGHSLRCPSSQSAWQGASEPRLPNGGPEMGRNRQKWPGADTPCLPPRAVIGRGCRGERDLSLKAA